MRILIWDFLWQKVWLKNRTIVDLDVFGIIWDFDFWFLEVMKSQLWIVSVSDVEFVVTECVIEN